MLPWTNIINCPFCSVLLAGVETHALHTSYACHIFVYAVRLVFVRARSPRAKQQEQKYEIKFKH